MYPQSVLSKNKKNIHFFFFQFFQLKKSLYITWACFRNACVLSCVLSAVPKLAGNPHETPCGKTNNVVSEYVGLTQT